MSYRGHEAPEPIDPVPINSHGGETSLLEELPALLLPIGPEARPTEEPEPEVADPASDIIITPIRDHEMSVRPQHASHLFEGAQWVAKIVESVRGDHNIERHVGKGQALCVALL